MPSLKYLLHDQKLNLPKILLERCNILRDDNKDLPTTTTTTTTTASSSTSASSSSSSLSSFILYLPTVVLRCEHNPAFTLACRIAKYYNIPLLILVVVLDDSHHHDHNHHSSGNNNIVCTARRLTFILQALQKCCPEWENVANAALQSNQYQQQQQQAGGVGTSSSSSTTTTATSYCSSSCSIAIRIHYGIGTRYSHHLTLAQRSIITITDEPFVYPYRQYVESLYKVSKSLICVDGSTIVPPITILKRRRKKKKSDNNNNINDINDYYYEGVPAKAWMYDKMTKEKRYNHIMGVIKDKHFDLIVPEVVAATTDSSNSSSSSSTARTTTTTTTAGSATQSSASSSSSTSSCGCWFNDQSHPLRPYLPRDWIILDTSSDKKYEAPGRRPWTVSELLDIEPETWTMQMGKEQQLEQQQQQQQQDDNDNDDDDNNGDGGIIDIRVKPCIQTHGGLGYERWKQFLNKHICQYANKRNDILQPYSVSRMSCYLNLGTVSIFQLIYDIWTTSTTTRSGSSSSSSSNNNNYKKFQDEIIKWREISYAHAFSTNEYFTFHYAIPKWSQNYLLSSSRTRTRQKNGASLPSSSSIEPQYTLHQLSNSLTNDDTWNAMQHYLVETGELHNNARMTWGKTIVHWQKDVVCKTNYNNNNANNYNNNTNNGGGGGASELMYQLSYLNDRYALDGLSPCSYAGLLWCLGWCDKPVRGTICSLSTKPASRYRVNANGFHIAQERLLSSSPSSSITTSYTSTKKVIASSSSSIMRKYISSSSLTSSSFFAQQQHVLGDNRTEEEVDDDDENEPEDDDDDDEKEIEEEIQQQQQQQAVEDDVHHQNSKKRSLISSTPRTPQRSSSKDSTTVMMSTTTTTSSVVVTTTTATALKKRRRKNGGSRRSSDGVGTPKTNTTTITDYFQPKSSSSSKTTTTQTSEPNSNNNRKGQQQEQQPIRMVG